jgi:hypothetical protein
MKMHGTHNGQPIDVQGSGRWVSADCGSVKPPAGN